MHWKRTAVFLLGCGLLGCQTKQPVQNRAPGTITATGYWIPPHVGEIKNLKKGPFVRLPDGGILTVDGNLSCISRDDGKTWTSYPVLPDTSRFEIGPNALVCTRKGVVILAFENRKLKNTWKWQSDIHDAKGAMLPAYAVRSLDGGKTWQDLVKLHDDWTGATRDIIETNDGTVVISSMIMRHDPGHHTVLTYASKDQGKSWTASNIIDLGGTGNHAGVMEATLVQLKDSRLWMLLRTNWGNFWQTFSEDDGITWKDTGPTTIAASSSPGIIKRLKSGRLALVFNRLFPEGKRQYPLRGGDSNLAEVPASWQREELSVMFSDNDGLSWSGPTVIAKAVKENDRLSYPYLFEAAPGVLWITTLHGGVRIKLDEKDFASR